MVNCSALVSEMTYDVSSGTLNQFIKGLTCSWNCSYIISIVIIYNWFELTIYLSIHVLKV